MMKHHGRRMLAAMLALTFTNALNAQNENFNSGGPFNQACVKADSLDATFNTAVSQMEYALQCAGEAPARGSKAGKVFPRTIGTDGKLVKVGPLDWCSGFFAGSLWQVYDFTKDPMWRQKAEQWTWAVEEAKSYRGTHDLGFMIGNSFGKGYELTGDTALLNLLIEASRTLISRFSPQVGCIRSWDFNRDRWKFPVIIDNMMNLEMLFRATQLTGDSTFWHVAVTHANTTMKNHFRQNASSWHVVDYDPQTGRVRERCTFQGHADDSYWSRGQSWGLYGFTMSYRFTRDEAYLRHARRIADFLLSLPNMPSDGIPYWDMKVPEVEHAKPSQPNASVPRDASSAAIMASALYELAAYVDAATSERYRATADHILGSLSTHYRAPQGTNYGFLLLHSTGHLPGNSEIDVPLNYADYYYLEALMRQRRWSQALR